MALSLHPAATWHDCGDVRRNVVSGALCLPWCPGSAFAFFQYKEGLRFKIETVSMYIPFDLLFLSLFLTEFHEDNNSNTTKLLGWLLISVPASDFLSNAFESKQHWGLFQTGSGLLAISNFYRTGEILRKFKPQNKPKHLCWWSLGKPRKSGFKQGNLKTELCLRSLWRKLNSGLWIGGEKASARLLFLTPEQVEYQTQTSLFLAGWTEWGSLYLPTHPSMMEVSLISTTAIRFTAPVSNRWAKPWHLLHLPLQ